MHEYDHDMGTDDMESVSVEPAVDVDDVRDSSGTNELKLLMVPARKWPPGKKK